MTSHLNEPRVPIVRAYPGIGAVQHKMADMAGICVCIRYGWRVDGLLVERQRRPGAVGAMVGRAVNG